jgi:hypothetical protein
VEKMFTMRDRLQAELEREFPEEQPKDLKSALYGIMRDGPSWKGNPEIAAAVGASRASALADQAKEIAKQETQLGGMYDQLKREAELLKAKGDHVDSIIISSHSDGANLTGETSNRLSANDISKLKLEEPGLFDSARHVLLLGCYNMTKPNHEVWRYDLFPNASLIAGFGLRAPIRFDNSSPTFIRQIMKKAQELDLQMEAAGKPLDPNYLNNAFKSLSSFTSTAHPGVVDYCYNILEGQPGAYAHDCDSQWADIYTKLAQYKDYWELPNIREDPPPGDGGVLRVLYNTLQAACPAKETPSQKDDWENSERLRGTLKEKLIRLINWWNIQQNFATYEDGDIQSMNARLAIYGIPSMPKLDGTESRVDFVQVYNITLSKIKARNPNLANDFMKLYLPLYYLRGETTVAPNQSISIEDTLARGAIPFNWIEGSTVLKGHS